MQIRPGIASDLAALAVLLAEVVQDGTTYVYDHTTPLEEVAGEWMTSPAQLWVADQEGILRGVYCLRPNRPGRGSHVANASYLVAGEQRGRGLGRRLADWVGWTPW